MKKILILVVAISMQAIASEDLNKDYRSVETANNQAFQTEFKEQKPFANARETETKENEQRERIQKYENMKIHYKNLKEEISRIAAEESLAHDDDTENVK